MIKVKRYILILLICILPIQLFSMTITPPMNLGLDRDITETDKLGYHKINGTARLTSVAVNKNGQIAVAGNYNYYNDKTATHLTVHNSDFTISEEFNDTNTVDQTNIYADVSVDALADGSFIVLSTTTNSIYHETADGVRKKVLRIGEWDTKVLAHPTDTNVAYVSGAYGSIVKFNPLTGEKDTLFKKVQDRGAPDFKDIKFGPDGNLYAYRIGEGLTKIDPNTGAVLQSFRSFSANAKVLALAIQSDGKILLGGFSLGNTSGKIYNNLIRINPNDTIDTTFIEQKKGFTSAGGAPGTGTIKAIEVNDKDEIFIAGNFYGIQGYQAIGGIAKLSKNGLVDEEFIENSLGAGTISGLHGNILDIEIQEDGKVILVGGFQGYNNLYQAGLVRIHTNGVLDTKINNTAKNLATDTGLFEDDASIVAAATATTRTPKAAGINIFTRNAYMNQKAVIYRQGEEALYNEAGYRPDYYGRVNKNVLSYHQYDVAGDYFIVAGGAASGNGHISAYNTDGSEKWNISAGTNQGLFSATDINTNIGLYTYRINDGSGNIIVASKLILLEAETGSEVRRIDVSEYFSDASFTPSGKYLYISTPNGYLLRYDPQTGEQLAKIKLPDNVNPKNMYNQYLHFYTESDFYIYKAISNRNDDQLIKYKLLNPDGIRIALDAEFGDASNPGKLWMNKQAGILTMGSDERWTVNDNGDVFLATYRKAKSVGDLGAGIARVGTKGIDVQEDYILVDDISSQGTTSDFARGNVALLDWGTGAIPKVSWTVKNETHSVPAKEGDILEYVFTVVNTGNVDISTLNINNVNCAEVPVLNSGDTDGNGIFNIGETFIYSCTSIAISQAEVDAGKINNTVIVNGTSVEGNNPPEISDTISTHIAYKSAIFLEKRAKLNAAGDSILYTFTVKNRGNTTLTNITINDPLVVVEGGPLATLEVGAEDNTTFTATYAITQADIDVGKVINLATVKAQDLNGNDINDTSTNPDDIACANKDECPTQTNVKKIKPDYKSILTVYGGIAYGIGNHKFSFDILVKNMIPNGQYDKSNPLKITIPKNDSITLTYNSTIRNFRGYFIDSSLWSFDDSDPFDYVITFIGDDIGKSKRFAIEGTFNVEKGEIGKAIIETTIRVGTGGDSNINNNSDRDTLHKKL